MAQYSNDDCLSAVQLAAWMIGDSPEALTIARYRELGMEPSARTIINRFEGWDAAKTTAADEPQALPTHLSQYYQSIAALRRARDIGGHPVTGLKYRDQLDIPIDYLDVLEPFTTWTGAKIHARVHTPGETPYEGIKPIDVSE